MPVEMLAKPGIVIEPPERHLGNTRYRRRGTQTVSAAIAAALSAG
jgi:hypothetical protein